MSKVIYIREWTKKKYEEEWNQFIKDVDLMIEALFECDLDKIESEETNGRK